MTMEKYYASPRRHHERSVVNSGGYSLRTRIAAQLKEIVTLRSL